MTHDTTDAARLLADAQAAEKNGDWLNATGKRSDAIGRLLDRTAPEHTPRALDPANDLEQLGELHKPSKRAHDYLRHYWRHLRDIRHGARKVVEVGVQTPRSIAMWEAFFPNATIYGLDIDPVCAAYAEGRKKIYIGDQMDETFLMKFIAETGGDFDVVIDDGLHSTYSMLKTFSYLYPALQSHGVYVIEDVQRQPEIITFLRGLMDCVNYVPSDFDLRDWPKLSHFPAGTPWLVSNTVGVALYRYIAFIDRGFNPRDNRFLKEPAEFDAIMAEHHATVVAGVAELKRDGIAVTRDNLIAKLGRQHANHVDRYLSGKI